MLPELEAPLPPEYFVVPTPLAEAPPAPPVPPPVVPLPPPFAPTVEAPREAPLKYVSPPAVAIAPPVPT